MGAIGEGGLFVVDVDIVPTQIGSCAHVMLPAAASGEANLTSMNGERRMRLTERYMDPPGSALPDALIVAKIAQALERSWRAAKREDIADKFKGYDWKTEEDAFMDGYHRHADGGEHVTYERLRAMGTDGFQEPAVGYQDRKIVGTKRLFVDGKFKTPSGKAQFAVAQWRGLAISSKQAEKAKFRFLINNGRSNQVWQSVYLDQNNDFTWDRFPLAYIQINPQDVAELKLNPGDLVEIYNDNGSTQAIVWPTPTAKRNETFMLFAYPTGAVGNIVNKGVNELNIPNYKQVWGNIRKLADAPQAIRHLSFKTQEYMEGSGLAGQSHASD
jgi:arsenite oxidase large subunit